MTLAVAEVIPLGTEPTALPCRRSFPRPYKGRATLNWTSRAALKLINSAMRVLKERNDGSGQKQSHPELVGRAAGIDVDFCEM